MNTLRFNGSLWCNLDIALRNLDSVYGQVTEPLGLTVLEWYILRALYQKDGRHASELAQTVGRAPTSFTPILDKLQTKNLVERRRDPQDRRAIYVHLTDQGWALRKHVEAVSRDIDTRIQNSFSQDEWQAFERILARLQAAALG